MSSPYQLDTATIEWRDNDVPASSDYDDIYFSKQHGLAETEYVFLQHNHLAQRWQQLDPNNPSVFSIAETGFGTGLNFLAAWRLWQQHAPADWQLHFISVEKHPLSKADLQRSLQAWPELTLYAESLIKHYPPLLPGHHLLTPSHGINLHLIFGDAGESFEQCLVTHHPDYLWQNIQAAYGPKVDAWFLDGFAPAKNPSMWSEQLFQTIGQLSQVGTTLATFTAAGAVRRGLIDAGFSLTKVKGFGQKREMLTAVLTAQENKQPLTQSHTKTRATAPWSLCINRVRPQHIAIIGGGIAGCTSAYALAKRGIKVSLIERHNELAQEASGNAQGMLYTKLSTEMGKLSQFSLSSFHFALRYYKNLLEQKIINHDDADFCGLLQLCLSPKQQQWLAELKLLLQNQSDWVEIVNPEQASLISNITSQHPGYFLKGSGWISPTAICQALSQHPNIKLYKHRQALSLNYEEVWQISDEWQQHILSADAVIIANSHDAKQFVQCQHLPLKVIRGQVSELDQHYFQQTPKTVICHEGYLTPMIDQQLRFGATFAIGDSDKSLRKVDHQSNLKSLQQALPAMLAQPCSDIPGSAFQGRANLRCTSPDYLPIVGPAPIFENFIRDYLPMNKDANRPIDIAGSYHPGLYMNIAHGSRGLSSSPLCGELLAAMICNEPRPLPRQLIEALNPGRFIIRDIIRGKMNTAC